jgi:hypothetical protein
VSALLLNWLMSAAPGYAFGAVATGVPDDVTKDGIAQGYSYGARTQADAEATAMKYCRQSKYAIAAGRCAVTRVFSGQCVSLSIDPGEATPGYGYGIGDDRASAEREAMVMCYETSPTDRTLFCKVTSTECDQ